MIYSSILLFQVFTVGGVLVNDNRTHRTFLVWVTALHLGALVCFFWTLVITALVRKFTFLFFLFREMRKLKEEADLQFVVVEGGGGEEGITKGRM